MKRLDLWTAGLALTILLCSPATAQDQHELNRQAQKEYQQADQQLNKVWKELLPLLTPEVKNKLVESQVLWIKFRDAEAAAKAASFEGGSMAPMLYSYGLKTTTEQRTQQLQVWLDDAKQR